MSNQLTSLQELIGSTSTATQAHAQSVASTAAAADAMQPEADFDDFGDAGNMQQLSDFQASLPGLLEQQSRDVATIKSFLNVPLDHPMNIQMPSVWTEWPQPMPSVSVYMDPKANHPIPNPNSLNSHGDSSHALGAAPDGYIQFDFDPLLNHIMHL